MYYFCGMKYRRLTKEQFQELEQEFINFLATQSITGEEWRRIKSDNPAIAETELDVFSDLIWEGVLNNVTYLEQISEQHMHLFYLSEGAIQLFSVKILNSGISLLTTEGFTWFRKNWQSEAIEYLTASKLYSDERNMDIFRLIEQGAVITKGELYRWFDGVIATT